MFKETMRKRNVPLRLLALGLLGSSFGLASADISLFEIARWHDYQQFSDTTVNAYNYSFTARIFTNTANEVTTATVTDPAGNVDPMFPQGPYVSAWDENDLYSTEAALNASHPTGVYTFAPNIGIHNGQTDTVDFEDPGWASVVPQLTGTSFSRLASVNPANDISITWNSFTSAGTYTALQTYFYLTDLTTNTQVIATQNDPGSFTGITITGGTLQAHHQYYYALIFGSLNQVQSTGAFSPGFATGSKYDQLNGVFTPVPEPAPILGLLPALLLLRRRRNR